KRAHAEAALADGVARAEAHWQAPATRLPEADMAPAMIDWARAAGLAQVVTPFAPVGPVADRVAELTPQLARAGIRLVPVRRRWDEMAFPHATRGFFQFRAAIPALVSA
ncbi:MAG: DNA photolyase FAD-binding protein, partial [Sphingomonadaceae bacterium]